MAVKYDDIYNEEYKKAIGNTVAKLEADRDEQIAALGKTRDTGKATAKSNYDAALANLKTAYDAQTKSLNNAYTTNKNQLGQNKNEALRQAYVSKMKETRLMPETLARQGLGGGVSETTLANITRNYQNNRNASEKNYNDNLTSLNNQLSQNQSNLAVGYSTDKTNALSNYNNALAGYDTDYSNALASLRSNYTALIANAKQNAISQALQQAGNRYNALQAEEAQAEQQAQAQAQAQASRSGGGDKITTKREWINGHLYNVTYKNGTPISQSLVTNTNTAKGSSPTVNNGTKRITTGTSLFTSSR